MSDVRNVKYTGREFFDIADVAALAACEKLDRFFPGGDRDGVTSDFQGKLQHKILEMLHDEFGVSVGLLWSDL